MACSREISISEFISAMGPPKCTGIIAFVRGPIASFTRRGSMLNVSRSISTNTGVAPTRETAVAVAMNEIAGTITSSPLPIPRVSRAISSVSVPFIAARPNLQCWNAANSRSNRVTNGWYPPQRSLSRTSSRSSLSRAPEIGQAGIFILLEYELKVLTDAQMMTMALAIVIPLSMLIYSNSRITELKETLRAEMGQMEARIDTRFVSFEARVDARFSALETKMDARFDAMDRKLDTILRM